jgi:indole-3-glycerol phosphate synthase/phosphoribosylanthranilate isomerase
MVLEGIVARKRREVAARKVDRPLATFVEELTGSDRSLAEALRKPRTGLILECKRASPSQGVIREDFDPVALATGLAETADAISVLTDEVDFGGRLGYLRWIRNAVEIPVLCKDFVVEPYQVFEARSYGADAILLMLSVLDDTLYMACRNVADALGVDVLTEVHDAEELERALRMKAPIIGINNRNLKTLQVDLATSHTLARQVPDDVVTVAESGIASHADLRSLRDHVDAFLVGTSLMKTPDPRLAARALAYGRVKICGLTSVEDAQAAFAAGARFGGLVRAPASARYVDLETAQAIVAAVEEPWVAVYVDAPIAQVEEEARLLGLVAVQLHGAEEASFVTELKERLSGQCAVWKAVGVGETAPEELPDCPEADRVVLDRFDSAAFGGTGKRFDWSAVSSHPRRSELLLAGGLNAENVEEADGLDVWALDCSSGVESAPGRKDPDKLAAFFGALRGVKPTKEKT